MPFSEELQDQLPALAATCSVYLDFTKDLATFYTERAALDRRYAKDLAALVRQGRERRSKRVVGLVAGESPARAFSDGDAVGRQHTLDSAWAKILGDSLAWPST